MDLLHGDDRRYRIVAILLGVVVVSYCVLDLLVLDRWSIQGRVFDSNGGVPVPGALVLVSVVGDSLRWPLPHASHTNEICIQSFTSTANDTGHFSISEVDINHLLINKKLIVSTLAPGWYQQAPIVYPATSSLVGVSSIVTVPMTKDHGERWAVEGSNSRQTGSQMNLQEDDLSRSLTEISKQLSSGRLCGVGGLTYMFAVLNYAAEHARTRSEKKFVLQQCSALASSVASLATSPSRRIGQSSIERDLTIPYGCSERMFESSNREALPIRIKSR